MHLQAAEAAAANETRQQRRLARHRERLKELRDEATAKAEGRPWPPPDAAPKPVHNGAASHRRTGVLCGIAVRWGCRPSHIDCRVHAVRHEIPEPGQLPERTRLMDKG